VCEEGGECLANGAHPSVHHVRGCHHVRACKPCTRKQTREQVLVVSFLIFDEKEESLTRLSLSHGHLAKQRHSDVIMN